MAVALQVLVVYGLFSLGALTATEVDYKQQ